jgi:hypothetical protein
MDTPSMILQLASGCGVAWLIARIYPLFDIGRAGVVVCGLVGGGLGLLLAASGMGLTPAEAALAVQNAEVAAMVGLAGSSAIGGGILQVAMALLLRWLQPSAS